VCTGHDLQHAGEAEDRLDDPASKRHWSRVVNDRTRWWPRWMPMVIAGGMAVALLALVAGMTSSLRRAATWRDGGGDPPQG